MIVAVTGASGFIGRAVVAELERIGYGVRAFDRPKHDVLGDLTDLDGAEALIHLAGTLGTAELFDAAEHAVNVNVIGTLRMLEWCAKNKAAFVGITMPPVFPSVYTATKICADRLATAWHRAKGLKVSRVCAFNAYGEHQKHGPNHPQKIVPTFATEAWNGRPIPIWGDGTQTVDLVHTDDLARMLVDALQFGDDEIFDGGTGVALTVNEVADFVIKVTGSTAGKKYLPMRAGEVPTQICAEGRGWIKLGWQPRHTWDRVEQAINWYKPRS